MKTGSQIKQEYGRIVRMVENYVRYCQNIGMTGIPLSFSTQPDPSSSFSSLEDLNSYLAQCRGCLVALNRRQPVAGEGNSKPILVFICGSPGSSEIAQASEVAKSKDVVQSSEVEQGRGVAQSRGVMQRKPLQGKEGELFNKIISSIGLTREDIYLTYAVKCPLPERETFSERGTHPDREIYTNRETRSVCEEPDCRSRRSSQSSQSSQSSHASHTIRRCRRLLFQELQLLKPHIICTLDSLATQMVVGKPGSIDDLRGNIFPLQLGESRIKVIPTYSPGYILYYSEDESRFREIKKLVWQDMQLIRKEYDKEYDNEHDKKHNKEDDQARPCSPT